MTCEYNIWEAVKRKEIATIPDLHYLSEKHDEMLLSVMYIKQRLRPA